MNTEVLGDPDEILDTARWLRTMSRQVDEVAVEFRAAAGESEATWNGQAGDGFRRSAHAANGHIGALHDDLNEAEKTLSTFAKKLRDVKAQMRHAREIARAGRLTVSGHIIEDPGGEVDISPPGPIDGHSPYAQQVAHQRATDAWRAQQEKREAYAQAKRVHDQARASEHEAHDTLGTALDVLSSFPAEVVSGLFGTGLDTVESKFSRAAENYKRLARKARGHGLPRAAGELDNAAGDVGKLSKGARVASRALPLVGVGVGIWADRHEGVSWPKAIVTNVEGGAVGAAAEETPAGPIGGAVAGEVSKELLDKTYDTAPGATTGALWGPPGITVGSLVDIGRYNLAHKDEIAGAASDAAETVKGAPDALGDGIKEIGNNLELPPY